MSNKRIKVAMTGVAGNVGYAAVFRAASGDMFGHDTEIELQLLELESSLPALKGVVMELQDCAFPLLKKITCTSDANVAMKDINWAILIGAAPRKKGMERSDLLEINGKIFSVQGRAINDHAASDVRVFVVGNPCNTNCLIAMNNAPDIPNDRFYAMTRLDHNRAKSQLAMKSGADVGDVTNVTIWGNHSVKQYPDFYNAKIKGRPVTEVVGDIEWLQNDFITTVQKRGAVVIEARGSSSAGSAAVAIANGVYSLTHDTPPGDSFSIALASQGQYGVEEGLIFSYPCRVENGEVKVVEDFELNDFGKERFEISQDELKHEREIVKKAGLF